MGVGETLAGKFSIPVADKLLLVSVAKEGAAALSGFTLEVDGIGRFFVITFSLLDVGAGEVLFISAGKISEAEDAEGVRTSCDNPACKLSVTKKLD